MGQGESGFVPEIVTWVDWTWESKLSVKQSLLDEHCRFDSFSAHCRLVGTELTFIRVGNPVRFRGLQLAGGLVLGC